MKKILFSILLLSAGVTQAQEDLFDMFGEEERIDYATASFKSSRIVLGQSIENTAPGNLVFLVQHQFGDFSQGAYEFWGLDQAIIRLGFDYGITEHIMVGIGRSSYNKTVDGYTKIRLLRQSSGARVMPISVSYFGGAYINGLKWENPERENYFASRMSYANQLLIARKFNSNLTLQLTPSIVHRNLVETREEENDVFSLGAGGRMKITKWISFNAEYIYLLPGYTADNFEDCFSVGLDLETGGHVFQLYVSNGRGMQEPYFIAENRGKWSEGEIHFAFTIHRTFNLKGEK